LYNIRLLLAVLHFNENYDRAQAKTKDGTERIGIAFPKQKRGEFTPKPIPVPKTYAKNRGVNIIYFHVTCRLFGCTHVENITLL